MANQGSYVKVSQLCSNITTVGLIKVVLTNVLGV